jgi:hypothetical protein
MGAESAAHQIEFAARMFGTLMDALGIAPGARGHSRMAAGLHPGRGGLHEAGTAMADALEKHRVKTGAGGGGGGVHVARVEITVSSNQDPNRVARVIASHLADLARYRKSSAYVPNFSASR